MIASRALLACLPALLAVPMLAQPQIGGGACSSATLSGNYAASFTGRDLNSSDSFTNAEYAVGSVAFDGLSKVTFTLTANTNKYFQTPETWAGTYTMQSNCSGTVTITSGDSATYTLQAYDSGKAYLMVGQNGVYSFTASGGVLPATCPTAIPAQVYSFNGNGFTLGSAQITGAYNISGLIQISGTNSISVSGQISTATGFAPFSANGTYSVSAGCAATANLIDTNGIAYIVTFELTSSTGANFTFISSGAGSMILASGRAL